jgi:hypothetical protein
MRHESTEIIPVGVDLCFSKQNCVRNPKMGSKQSIVFNFEKHRDPNGFQHSQDAVNYDQHSFHGFWVWQPFNFSLSKKHEDHIIQSFILKKI